MLQLRMRAAAVASCNLAPLRTFVWSLGVEETMSTRARSSFNAALDGAALGLAAVAAGMLALWWWMLF
jgi:hypothetical protein